MEHIHLFHVKRNGCFIELSAENYTWNRETEAESYFTSICVLTADCVRVIR